MVLVLVFNSKHSFHSDILLSIHRRMFGIRLCELRTLCTVLTAAAQSSSQCSLNWFQGTANTCQHILKCSQMLFQLAAKSFHTNVPSFNSLHLKNDLPVISQLLKPEKDHLSSQISPGSRMFFIHEINPQEYETELTECDLADSVQTHKPTNI